LFSRNISSNFEIIIEGTCGNYGNFKKDGAIIWDIFFFISCAQLISIEKESQSWGKSAGVLTFGCALQKRRVCQFFGTLSWLTARFTVLLV